MPQSYRKVSPLFAGLVVLAVPALSQTVQAQSFPVTHYGDRGPVVKTAESSLKKLGYYHGAIDGVFGPELLFAVRSFQAHYGLAQDGILGPETWDKLSVAASTLNATPKTAAPDRAALVLRMGSHGTLVVRLQRLLDAHGFHLAQDGQFGPLTYSALRQFQASHGMVVDGIATAHTFAVLEQHGSSNASVSPTMEAAPPTYPPGYLHLGDRGPAVRKLQSELNRAGYATGGVDGIFGPMTLRAVQAFQSAEHLPAYGLVGSLTWNALSRVLSFKAAPTLSNRGSVSPTATAIVGIALKYQGYPYVWGGNTPSGFDCSGFVQWVYSQVGIALPRTSFAQWDVGQHVSYDDLSPGDLVFFTTEGTFTNHVGIYLGGGEFISAATPAQGVVVQSLNTPFFAQAYDGAVQIVN